MRKTIKIALWTLFFIFVWYFLDVMAKENIFGHPVTVGVFIGAMFGFCIGFINGDNYGSRLTNNAEECRRDKCS